MSVLLAAIIGMFVVTIYGKRNTREPQISTLHDKDSQNKHNYTENYNLTVEKQAENQAPGI